MEQRMIHWGSVAKQNAGWLIGLGILTVVAGIFSIAAPFVGGLAIAMFIGFALLVAGAVRLVATFKAHSFGQGALSFLGGALGVIAGVIMVARPAVGLTTVTLMIGVYLLVDGIFGSIVAFGVRPEKGWGAMLFGSALGFLLGFLLLAEWPISGLWAVGTLVGINLVFSGLAMISMGSAARGFVERTS